MRAWLHGALIVGLTFLVGCNGTPPPELPPDLGPIEVGALGRLEPEWKVYQIAAPASMDGARIEKLLVQEGGEVKENQIIAELDSVDRRKAALLESQAQVAVARARLALVEAGARPEEIAAQKALVDQLHASLVNAESNYTRAIQLRRSATISTEELDAISMRAQTAKFAYLQSKATLRALEKVRPEDVALARAELQRAQAGVARAEADLEASRVRSPINGRALKVHARQGERVGDKGVVEIGNTANMEAVAEVHETDVPLVRLGQRATVRLRTRAADELAGTVVHIGQLVGRRIVLDNDPVKDSDARVVEIRIRLDNSSLVAGLSNAQVEVIIHTHEGK